MSAERIRQALRSAPTSERDLVLRQQADEFEDELLGTGQMPDDYVDLFVEIISTAPFATHPGTQNFIVRMYTDREKLNSVQLERILRGFERGYGLYRDERVQLLASDFVARCYPPLQAINAIALMAKGVDKQARTALKVGLETIMHGAGSESEEHKLSQQLYKTLS